MSNPIRASPCQQGHSDRKGTPAKSDANVILHPTSHTHAQFKINLYTWEGAKQGWAQTCWKSWAACIYLLNVCLYFCIYTHKTQYTCCIFLYVYGGSVWKKSTKFCHQAEERWNKSSKHSPCDSTLCPVISSVLPCVYTPSYPTGCDSEIPWGHNSQASLGCT